MNCTEKIFQKLQFSNFIEKYEATGVKYYNAGYLLYLRQVRLQGN